MPPMRTPARRAAALLAAIAAITCPRFSTAATDQAVYTDALPAGWADWSWNTTLNFAAAAPVHGGTAALSARYTAAWAGVYLHSATTLAGADYDRLRFWLHGGTTGGQRISVTLYDGSLNAAASVEVTAAANTWTLKEITLADFGSPGTVSGVVWQDATGGAQPVFYLDDALLVARTGPPPQSGGPALGIDASADNRAISADIYGMNFPAESLAQELRLPVARYGGNATTRYNWQNDTANHAMDWYFENIPNDNANPGALPTGSASDQFVDQNRRTGTQSIITVPLIGWTPKARAYAGGFSVAKYGAQQDVDPWRTDMGNGVRTNGTKITGNDPADTSVAIGPAFVSAWIAHLQARYGTAAAGGVRFYNLDNEPELWSDTHRDVRPQALGYDEIRDRTFQYGAAVKAADPGARTLGPVGWGWTAYFYSNLDWAGGGSWWNNPPDRNAHGGTPFVEWYLQQMRAYEQTTGTRILDYLDLHYYPQAGGVSLGTAGSAATQALRLRSVRGLWDPAYTDESWINEPVMLIPRMRAWVQAHYPGTRIAMTEYNWGGLEHINGALAQAEVLGVMGREGMDLACLWGPPTPSQPGAYAFRMFRNYDGSGAAFGETSVRATSGDASQLSAFAAKRAADGALTAIAINKTATDLVSTTTLTGFTPASPARMYTYSATNLNAIVRAPDLPVSAGRVVPTYPANSISVIVVPAATARVEDWERH